MKKLLLLICLPILFIPLNGYASSTNESKTVIISMPRISWHELDAVETPHIDRLINQGSVANLSVRVPGPGRSIEKGYATLSAGIRASAVNSTLSTFYAPDEDSNFGTAKEIFKKEQGVDTTGAAALLLGAEMTFQENTGLQAPANVGALATSLNENNRSIAVFGNSDYCSPSSPECSQRSIGFLGSNDQGIVSKGEISRVLLNEDLTLNMAKMTELMKESISENDVSVAECSNLEKSQRWERVTAKDVIEARFETFMKECDDFIGDIVKELDLDKDRIFIVSPMSSVSVEQLTTFIAAGKNIETGYATGGITRRDAIVALGDLAPSILKFYDIVPPNTMVDTELAFKESQDTLSSKYKRLIDTDTQAQLRDDTFNAVSAVFIATVFASSVLGLLSISKFKSLRRIAIYVGYAAFVMTIVPFLLTPFMLNLGSPSALLIAFILLSLGLSAVAYFMATRLSFLQVLCFLSLFNIVVLITDIFSGGHLQFNSIFGNSSIVAGRFAGFGNMAYSILAMSSIVFIASVKHLTENSGNKKRIHLVLIAFLVFVLVSIGAPIFGSDVGGVLAFTPTVVIIALMFFDRKINVKSLLVAFVATIASISIFSIFDLNREASERTHLGRFVQVLGEGEAGVVLQRKIMSNLDTFTNSIFLTVVLLGSLYCLVLFTKPEQFLKAQAKQITGVRYILYPGIVLMVLSMLLNDSGIAIGGMMAAIAVPALIVLIFSFDEQYRLQAEKAEQKSIE